MKTLLMWTLAFIFFGSEALADFEALETTLGKLEDVQKEAQNVQEQLKEVQAKLNALRQGDFGQLSGISSSIQNLGKVDLKLISSVADKVGDVDGLKQAVASTMLPQYEDKDQSSTYIETRNAVNAVRRENLSRMYAYALTLRTNMEKNRQEGGIQDTPVSAENSREILQSATTKEAMENARRVAHIWDMQASIDELKLIETAQRYSGEAEEKTDDEAEGDK